MAAGSGPTLAYDSLPAGSNLWLDRHVSGITITAPAGELGQDARRALAIAALLPAGLICAAALGVGLLVLGRMVNSNRLPRELLHWAVPCFALFCLALLALI